MIDRRRFIKSTMSLILAPSVVKAQNNNVRIRMDAREFFSDSKKSDAFIRGISAMRTGNNEKLANGLSYWWYVHMMPDGRQPPPDMAAYWQKCPHHDDYFFVWHRAYIVAFEVALRKAANDPMLNIPYWNYFEDGRIPDIFTASTWNGKTNPLLPVRANRVNSSVDEIIRNRAVAYVPFANHIKDFDRSFGNNSFEEMCEGNIHDQVHDHVGGSLGNPSLAVDDPLFWLHHVNIDRLWSTWLRAGQGRKMQPKGAAYWTRPNYRFAKSSAFNVSFINTRSEELLNYKYADTSMPKRTLDDVPSKPKDLAVTQNASKLDHAMSTETSQPIILGRESVSLSLQVPTVHQDRIAVLSSGEIASQNGLKNVYLVLENLSVENSSNPGGVVYDLYINLPVREDSPRAAASSYFVKSITAFQVLSGHHNDRLVIDITKQLKAISKVQKIDPAFITASFIRVGTPTEKEKVIKIGKIRVEGS